MLIPGLIAGLLSTLGSWLWMGLIFHRFQGLTPQTWRLENAKSYVASSTLHVLTAVAIAVFFSVLKRHTTGLFVPGAHGAVTFAFTLWAIFALPLILHAAIFIRLHPLVVVGQLLDWLTTSLLATLITAWWRRL